MTDYSYYSYCRKSTGREFFVPVRTLIAVKLLMDSRDLQYLNNTADHAQYPVKRCEQGAYRYHCQTSQGSEVMCVENINLHAPTAVCPVNAAMLTIKTVECRHFKTQQTSAWGLENEFS